MSRTVFNLSNLTIDESSRKSKYFPRINSEKSAIESKKRCQLISDIEFLTIYSSENDVCFYFGGGEYDLNTLAKMFPNIKFISFYLNLVSDNENLVVKGEFNDDFIIEDCLLIFNYSSSDYRNILENELSLRGLPILTKEEFLNNKYPYDLVRESLSEAKKKNEKLIIDDLELQLLLMKKLNPKHAWLKFLPLSDYYLRGVIYWKIWSCQIGQEVHLKPAKNPKGEYELSYWDPQELKDLLYHHNSIIREKKQYFNPLNNTLEEIDSPFLTNDYDSTAETVILKLYSEKIDNELNIIDLSRKISELINENIKEEYDPFKQ